MINSVFDGIDSIDQVCRFSGIEDWEEFRKSDRSVEFYSKKGKITIVGDNASGSGVRCSELELALEDRWEKKEKGNNV